ncbi:hypothetical protein CF319_g1576 [Tilletia indica]|nr:hypothetical protein CF319_g1576 [Tilletia indica]
MQPIKLAIIGSGPSAFYAATRALTSPSTSAPISAVHIYESLPTPFGLVRAGVAPDHPDVKNVTHRFTEVVRSALVNQQGTGGVDTGGPSSDGVRAGTFRFFGNVRVVAAGSSSSSSLGSAQGTGGTALELPLQDLLRHYTHIILAYGSAQARTLGSRVTGQDLRGVCSALDFVNWYNGHPDAHPATTAAAAERNGPASPWLDVVRPDARHVSIIGAGNVALDVARILLRARSPTSSFLAGTDIPSPVLSRLADTRVEHVSIVARRGVAQVAFTNKEVREMLTLGESEGIDFVPLSKESGQLALEDVARLKQLSDDATRSLKAGEFGSMGKEAFTKHASELSGELRIRKRLVDLLIKGSKAPKPDAAGHRKSWSLEPFRAPEAIQPSTASSSGEGSSQGRAQVGSIRWSVTEPVPSSSGSSAFSAPSPAPTSPAETPTWGGGSPPQLTEPQWGSVRSTGKMLMTDTDAVVYSLGYVGAPLPLPSDASGQSAASQKWQQLIPFDQRRAMIKNDKGSVEWNSEAAAHLGLDVEELPRVYTTGWIGRGPVGVIATTMYDAYDTVDLMLAQASSTTKDISDPAAPPSRIQDALLAHRTGQSSSERRGALTPRTKKGPTGAELAIDGLAGRVVEWEDWEIVDEFERAAGAAHMPDAKEREKVLTFT